MYVTKRVKGFTKLMKDTKLEISGQQTVSSKNIKKIMPRHILPKPNTKRHLKSR